MLLRPAALLPIAVTLLALGCPSVATRPPEPPPQPAAAPKVVWRTSKNGLGFRLGDAGGGDDRPAPRAKADPLSDADTARVLSRLPPIAADKDDEQAFALRDRSRPPPRTGRTVSDPFPPPAAPAPPPVASTAPLRVTRKAPVGPVAIAPSLTVSFSAPMVAITSHDDLSRTPPPVTLTPAPPGKWRWAGSQTVIFDPDKRFPMATEYTVEVPAGTRGAGGQALAAPERWTFTTPAPKVVTSYPQRGPVGLTPVLYVELDQAVDAKAVLGMIEVTGGSGKIALRTATEEEIEADRTVRMLADKAQPGRWIAFRATDPLEPGKGYVVHLPAGLPSAEGPRRTDQEQHFSFSTYEPLRLTGHSCGWRVCPPGAPWYLRFDNALDEKRFDRSWIKVSPEPASIEVEVAGSGITLRPRSRGQTKYTITVAPQLADVFGQTLGKEASVEVAVDRAEPELFAEEDEMSVLDPGGSPALPVFSVNRPSLNVSLYAVTPEDFPRYRAWRRAWDEDGKLGKPPGKRILSRVVKPEQRPDELVMTPVDLGPALREGLGQVLVVVEPTGRAPRDRWARQWVRTWVQVTRIGIDTLTDGDSTVAWTTRLADGAPLEGVDVAFLPAAGGAAVPSDKDGLARLSLGGASALLLARKGPDLAFLPGRSRWDEPFERHVRGDELRWFVFDDRGTYRPGEEVHAKGWIRSVGRDKGGDVRALPAAAGSAARWTLRDVQGVPLGKGSAAIDAGGGFDLAFKLPDTPNLGPATLDLELPGAASLPGARASHRFEIQEFRRPEFEVGARASEGPFFVGDHADVTVSATYYAGGGLPNAEVSYRVTRSDARFVPPNRGEYAFGKASDFWWIDRARRRPGGSLTWKGRTGPSGEHTIRADFDAVDPPYPMSLSFDASVTDVNRQAWSAHTSVLVHPASVYVGVRQDRSFVKAGDPLGVDLIVTDVDGRAVAGRTVRVETARVDWRYKEGEPVEVEQDADACTVTSAAEAVRCSLKTKEGGRYRVTATVTDEHGRRNRTETHLWVTGGSTPPDATLQQGKVEIIPSKSSYRAGETAELLVIAPFAPAEGLLAVDRQGVVHLQRFRLEGRTGTVRFPVEAAWTPNVTARVSLAGAALRDDAHGVPDPSLPRRPAFAVGSIGLAVPPVDRRLSVAVKPRDARLSPGGSTVVDLDLRDASGAAVPGATAAVVVVDEAVLSLSQYATPDPIAFFYDRRPARVDELGLRERVLVARPEDKHLRAKGDGGGGFGRGGGMIRLKAMATAATGAPMGKMAPSKHRVITLSEVMLVDDGEGRRPIALRKDLRPLALFSPAVITDAQGHASVEVKLPDSLTRYRVMAVAAAGDQRFGSAEATITARLPLMVRPSAPRFLNYGDRFDLPVVLQNQTDAPLSVDVAVRASNAALTAGAGRRVTVPANDRVEVRFPAAAVKPGKARFQVGAAAAPAGGGPVSDAAEISLPVWTPATTEAFATYGTVDQGAVAQPVKMPAGVERSFGGVEITTSSTAVSALTDAVLYLVRYPFECNEQISSRVLAVAALRDVLSAFSAKGMPSKAELDASMARDIEKLRARQHWSGGWDFWLSDREPWPYLSVHVAHALSRAKEKGYAVPRSTLDAALTYLRRIDRHVPGWYSRESRRAIVAYALYVRKRLGDADPARARKLLAESGGAEKAPVELLGWILPTLSDDPGSAADLAAVRRQVENRVSETAGAAHFTSSYDDGAYVLLASDRRADAILLEGLIGDQPKSDLIPKLAAGLLAHETAGRWASTQENAFVLLALDRYFATYEKATPDFVARAWLGDRYAGDHAFKGRTTERHEIDVPMATLADVGKGDVVIEKDGPGRLYYRIGMRYAPSDLRPPPAEHGFSVTRAYESVGDPSDVRRDADGVWHVKAGAEVRVRLTMVAPARRYHVALVDPLPAGIEVMNPALAVTGPIPHDEKSKDPGVPWWWTRTWYDHQNLRDDRVEAFASLLWEGVYEYTYVARATTPGTFVVPPPKAEEMYSPETFGRGAGDRLVVE